MRRKALIPCVCARKCVCGGVRVCVRACVRACVCVCVGVIVHVIAGMCAIFANFRFCV